MKSVRFRKLIESTAIASTSNSSSLTYSVSVSPTITSQCRLELVGEQQIRSLEKSPSFLSLLSQFKSSFELPEQILGKKSAEISITKDYRLCLKNISREDLTTFKDIFDLYIELKKKEKDSILVPLLAVFVVHTLQNSQHSQSPNHYHQEHSPNSSEYYSGTKWIDSFIIMPNVQPKGSVFFDLKGHCDNRCVAPADFRDFGFGKDQNFIKSEQLQLLRQSSQQFKLSFFQRVEKTLFFLRKCDIIDYSLALIFRLKQTQKDIQGGQQLHWQCLGAQHEIAYYIIDYLQVYNQRKKLQNKVKSLFFKEISSVDPDYYAQRLLQFLKKSIF